VERFRRKYAKNAPKTEPVKTEPAKVELAKS
jgi:hypothetical protein